VAASVGEGEGLLRGRSKGHRLENDGRQARRKPGLFLCPFSRFSAYPCPYHLIIFFRANLGRPVAVRMDYPTFRITNQASYFLASASFALSSGEMPCLSASWPPPSCRPPTEEFRYRYDAGPVSWVVVCAKSKKILFQWNLCYRAPYGQKLLRGERCFGGFSRGKRFKIPHIDKTG